jgi:hypothetical protein
MRRREGQPLQISQPQPASGAGHGGQEDRTRLGTRPIGAERDAITGDGMAHGPKGRQFQRIDPQKLSETAPWIGPIVHFDIGKLPEPRVDHVGRPLQHQPLSLMFEQESLEVTRGGRRSAAQVGEPFRVPASPTLTIALEWTVGALWLARETDGGAQLHQRLIQERAGPTGNQGRGGAKKRRSPSWSACRPGHRCGGGSHQDRGEIPKLIEGGAFPGIGVESQPSREDPDHISVEDRIGLVEGDAANGSGGVTADAWQSADGLKVSGEPAPMLAQQLLGGLLKVASSRIISEAFPEFENPLRFGLSQGPHVRQCLHPAFPIWNDGLDLRLLEHDLRDPDRIRIQRPPPGQVPRILDKPPDQGRRPIPDVLVESQ